MSFTKTKIYNLALSILMLQRQVSNADSDTTSNEVKVLNLFYDDALTQTLKELDLDRLSEPFQLELLANLNEGPWAYVYKYPTRCAFLRRIQSSVPKDTRCSAIEKRVGQYNGQTAIFTNQPQAVIEMIPKDVSLAALPPSAGWALAHQLAFLSTPLLTGKGAKSLSETIQQKYLYYLASAKEDDQLENFNYEDPWVASEYVAARME